MRIFIPLPPNFLSVTVLLWPVHVCCSEVNSIAHWVTVFRVIKTIDSYYISVVSSDTWGFNYIHSVIGSFHCWFVRIGWQNKQNIAGLPQAHVLIRSADLCAPGRCVTSLPLAEIQNIWISLCGDQAEAGARNTDPLHVSTGTRGQLETSRDSSNTFLWKT